MYPIRVYALGLILTVIFLFRSCNQSNTIPKHDQSYQTHQRSSVHEVESKARFLDKESVEKTRQTDEKYDQQRKQYLKKTIENYRYIIEN